MKGLAFGPRQLVALAALGSAFRVSLANAQSGGISGSWRGTSICVDKEHFPACNDEQVIYDVHFSHGTRDTVTLRADKLVGGAHEFMSEFHFTLAADSSWVAEFQSSRYHGRIVLRVVGNHMTGTLTDVASGRAVRNMLLDRIP